MSAGCVVVAVAVVGCGANRPDIPPELLASPDGGSSFGGTEEGEVIGDLSFAAWMNPTGKAASDPLAQLSLANVIAEDVGAPARVLYLSFSTEWCSQCKEEHKDLPTFYSEAKLRGLRVFTLLFENNDKNIVVDASTIVRWSTEFGTNFPLGIDPAHVGANRLFGGSASPPLNIIIDTRTMKISRKIPGGDIFTLLNEELAKP